MSVGQAENTMRFLVVTRETEEGKVYEAIKGVSVWAGYLMKLRNYCFTFWYTHQ